MDAMPVPIGTAYEASVAEYWNAKRDDQINLLLGAEDGLIHHHYGVGDFDHTILDLSGDVREPALLRELHRLENRQTELILDAFGAVGSHDRLLDAGSGRGGTSFMLNDRFGCRVDGITISEYQVAYASRLASERGCADRVAFHLRNMVRTGFPAGRFDGVVTNETTMYVDLFELYREFARIVRPGGQYVCVTWCINDSVGPAKDTRRIDTHYGCAMHRRSEYFKALAAHDFVPYAVVDLTTDGMPYWELRRHSAHRTGIEDAFLTAYRQRAANFLLLAAEYAPPRMTSKLVLLLLAGYERPPARPPRPGPADLHLGAVDPQPYPLGGGVGEHVRQGAQPQPGLAGHREPAGGQQRPDLVHRPGDGRPVHLVEDRQRRMRQLEPQDDQGGDHPVRERQLMTRARACGAQPVMAPALPQPRLLPGQPRRGQLLDQRAEPAAADTSADTVRQGRTGPS
jgi:geranyl diphosphate 2-C-methyltransferase